MRSLTPKERLFLKELVATGAAAQAFMCLGSVYFFQHPEGGEDVRDIAMTAYRKIRALEEQR